MYEATTNSVRVRVKPRYLPDRSDPAAGNYFWAYTIEITNEGMAAVQLQSRHWRIIDANGRLEEVRGPGVVGEQPILGNGESFVYTSGVPLATSSGLMSGQYRMVNEDGNAFDVEVPAFSLDTPFSTARSN
ncbi:MAG: Co2+/Mg2+ efflux protein ApaG [Rhizobiales bacterium]|nr:Co2+/Mg2+ efflux protein ApaG [Hyphomicrobiales bacterium]